MSIALRENLSTLSRRAFDLLPMIYIALGFIAVISTGLAVIQAFGYSWYPTHLDARSGLFFSPIAQGGFLGLVIVALISISLWELVPILLVGLYLAHNRGGWIITGVGILATCIRQPLVILLVILFGASIITANPGPSDLERFNIWRAGIANLTWFGNGWGSFEGIWIIQNGLGYHPIHAHNDYLQLAFELGLYSIPIFCVLAYALSRTQAHDWPLLVAFCTMALFAMPSYIPATAGIGALALASVLYKGDDNG